MKNEWSSYPTLEEAYCQAWVCSTASTALFFEQRPYMGLALLLVGFLFVVVAKAKNGSTRKS